MNARLQTLKKRLGPLWWYAALIFMAQRLGDLINIIIGLWLVPKYVSPDELGAVLPLSQVGSVLGLPLAIILIPFGKFINVFAARNELGKIKSLLRDVFVASLSVGILIVVAAPLLMPKVFSSMRIQKGMLPWLIVTAGVSTTIAPLFVQALQGLKKFKEISLLNIFTPPIRLIVMLVTMPIRGISGYFSGQLAANTFSITLALINLRHLFKRSIAAIPYKHEWRAITAFMIPVALITISGRLQNMAEFSTIRYKLPDLDSAAYYFITRFADLPIYFWGALSAVLLPLVSERHETGQDSRSLLNQSMLSILIGGCILALILHLISPTLFNLLPMCQPYHPFTYLMGMVSLTSVFRTAIACFTTYELACRRYHFVALTSLIYLTETTILYIICMPAEKLHHMLPAKLATHPILNNFTLTPLLALFLIFASLPLLLATYLNFRKTTHDNR